MIKLHNIVEQLNEIDTFLIGNIECSSFPLNNLNKIKKMNSFFSSKEENEIIKNKIYSKLLLLEMECEKEYKIVTKNEHNDEEVMLIKHALEKIEHIKRKLYYKNPITRYNEFSIYIILLSYVILWLPIIVIGLMFEIPIKILKQYKYINTSFSFESILCRYISKSFLRLIGIRINLLDFETIGNNEPYVFSLNHYNVIDPIITYCLPYNFYGLMKKEIYNYKLFNIFFKILNIVEMNRGNLEEINKSFNLSKKFMEEYKLNLCITPEGTRTKTGRLNDFKKGVFHHAIDLNRPFCLLYMFINPKEKFNLKLNLFKPNDIYIKCIKKIEPHEFKDYNQLYSNTKLEYIEEIMENGDVPKFKTKVVINDIYNIFILPLLYYCLIKLNQFVTPIF
jgi:1-acyl-sn-glycerol-3-phosphate acyltransferase